MKKLSVIISTFALFSCGMPQAEKDKIAAVTCSIISETKNMDAALRVEKINDAREKLGEAPYLLGDLLIRSAVEKGLCKELVLNEGYAEGIQRFNKLEELRLEKLALQRRQAIEKRALEKKQAIENQRKSDL